MRRGRRRRLRRGAGPAPVRERAAVPRPVRRLARRRAPRRPGRALRLASGPRPGGALAGADAAVPAPGRSPGAGRQPAAIGRPALRQPAPRPALAGALPMGRREAPPESWDWGVRPGGFTLSPLPAHPLPHRRRGRRLRVPGERRAARDRARQRLSAADPVRQAVRGAAAGRDPGLARQPLIRRRRRWGGRGRDGDCAPPGGRRTAGRAGGLRPGRRPEPVGARHRDRGLSPQRRPDDGLPLPGPVAYRRQRFRPGRLSSPLTGPRLYFRPLPHQPPDRAHAGAGAGLRGPGLASRRLEARTSASGPPSTASGRPRLPARPQRLSLHPAALAGGGRRRAVHG